MYRLCENGAHGGQLLNDRSVWGQFCEGVHSAHLCVTVLGTSKCSRAVGSESTCKSARNWEDLGIC